MVTPLDVLKKSLDHIKEPENFCQGCLARTARGIPVPYNHPKAVKFCALGITLRMQGNDEAAGLMARLAINKALEHPSLSIVNDGADGHRRIVEGFQKAIASLEKKRRKK